MRRLAVLVLLVACQHTPEKPHSTLPDITNSTGEVEQDRRQRLIAELQDEILSSYERDEVPDIQSDMFPQNIGATRIGVGPGDVYYGEGIRNSPSRWPLRLAAGTPTSVRSKRLDIHLSLDKLVSAAWMSDELSWRIGVCGRTVVIPLRITALYAHDGDRWVQVFEHLSYGRIPQPSPDGQLFGQELRTMVVSQSINDELSRSLGPLLLHHKQDLLGVVSIDRERLAEDNPKAPAPTLLLAPDPEGEWHGEGVRRQRSPTDQPNVVLDATEDVEGVRLVDGTLSAEDRRIGTVGRSASSSSIAYWVGNFVASLNPRPGSAAGKVRLRGTFIFEKRAGRWIIVQGHLSQPSQDYDLAIDVFGTALETTREDFEHGRPLSVTCDGNQAALSRFTPAAEP